MPIRYKKRVPAAILKADCEVLIRVQSLEGYSPRNPAYSIPALQQLMLELRSAQEADVTADRAAELAAEHLDGVGMRVHDTALAVKLEVTNQYGEDSPALYAVNRTPKSARRRPTRKPRPA